MGDMKNKITPQDICLIGIFAAIIAAMAQIRVPIIPPVPFTMQTFAVPLAGAVLGAKRGAASVGVYLLIGAIGVPVFNGFVGGPNHFVGPTGGFLLSFPLMALTAAIGASFKKHYYLWLTCGLAVGAVINYICGMLMFSYVTGVSVPVAFARVVVPFIPGGVVKMFMVILMGKPIKKAISHHVSDTR
jgi:biotin transport system substrate-specific component